MRFLSQGNPVAKHPLNEGLLGWWLALPQAPGRSGWGSMYVRDLLGKTHAPAAGGHAWAGAGRPGGRGAVGCTGGAHFDVSVPAVSSSDDFAISLWHRPATWTGGFTPLFDDSGRFWTLFFNTSGVVSFHGGIFTGAIAGFSMPAGPWYHVCVTRVGGAVSAYQDAVRVFGPTGFTATTATAATLHFGDNPSTGGSNYDGRYDDVRLYVGRGLTDAAVAALYSQSRRGHPHTLRWLVPRAWVLGAGSGGGGPAAYTLATAAGAFTLAGQAAGLRAARTLTAAAGTFTLAGQTAALRVGHTLAAGAGTFALAGQAAGLRAARVLPAGAGAFALAGQAAGIRATRVLSAAAGTFALAGQAAALVYSGSGSTVLPAGAGAFSLAGQAALLRAARRLQAGVGTFTLTGRAAALTWSGEAAGGGVVTPPALAVADAGDGTGGTATLTGGDLAATNTLYRALFISGGGTLAFTASGTRTGPGTVPITGVPIGSYLWQVVAALGGATAPSNLVLRALTDAGGEGRVYYPILVAVRDRLAALGLGIPVRVRKKLIRMTNDPLPLLLVAPGKGGEAVVKQTFGYRAYWDYPVSVAFITAGNQQLEAGLQAHMATREDIRNELLQARLPGVERVFRAEIDPEEVAQFAQALGTNYDVDGFGLVCRTSETRKG